MYEALKIIREEHRRLAALMQGVQGIIEDIRGGRLQPDYDLFHTMIDYLGSFLYRYHHPKEDQYLFPVLKERAPEVAETVAALEEQHRRGDVLLQGLRSSLRRYEERGAEAFEDFARAVSAYHDFEREHMGREEREILPLARDRLQEADWARLSEAFTAHADPMFGDRPRTRFRALFSEIANRAPAPHGLGPARPPGRPPD